MFSRTFIFVFLVVVGVLGVPDSAVATIDLAQPPARPVDGAGTGADPDDRVSYGCEEDNYFLWPEVSGTHHYELIIAGVVQRADNIEPTACSGGVCGMWFCDPARPATIDCANTYSWKIEAQDSSGAIIEESSFATFTTQDCPGPEGPGDGDAGNGGTPSSAAPIENPISSETFPELLENVLNFLFGLAIVILPIVIIYGGILLLGGGGDPQKVSRGKTILLWAVIAFAIILLARGLPAVLRALL